MSLRFCSHTSSARLNIFLNKIMESGPSVVLMDKVNGFILAGMSGEDKVMFVMENTEPKVVSVGNINEAVMAEKSVSSNGPMGLRFFRLSLIQQIIRKSG